MVYRTCHLRAFSFLGKKMINTLICILFFLQACLLTFEIYISNKQIEEASRRNKELKKQNTSLFLENIELKEKLEERQNEEKNSN